MVRRVPYSRRTDDDAVLPPEFPKLGTIGFSASDSEELATWLDEAGWPREVMDRETLEGYLMALIVWPVDLPSGAWLPSIWGGRGWKLPSKLEDPKRFARFVTLTGGFLQDLDRQLTDVTHPYVPDLQLPSNRPDWRPRAPCRWATGFVQALQQFAHGLKYRSTVARRAAEAIAYWSTTPPVAQTAAELSRAIRSLESERTTRGPLGSLLARASPPDSERP